MLLTNEQLKTYDGVGEGVPIYLALNRTIYDVSSSPHIYGPGGPYSSLAAKDASRSYITTCFDPVNDLVPYFGGVEEIYVPLWLSKKPPKDEMDEMAGGDRRKEIYQGKDAEDVMEDIRRKVGLRKFRKYQRVAYEKAHERVRQQVQTWEGMFERKGYPIIGKVIGVNETDISLWKKLKFCEAAKKQRPPMTESLSEAMEDQQMDKMNLDMKTPKPKKKAGKPKKKPKKEKGAEADEESEADRPPVDEADDIYAAHRGGHEENPKANANFEDMRPGGQYGLKEGQEPAEWPEAIQNVMGGEVREEESDERDEL